MTPYKNTCKVNGCERPRDKGSSRAFCELHGKEYMDAKVKASYDRLKVGAPKLRAGRPSKYPDHVKATARELYAEGNSHRVVSAILNVPYTTVIRWCVLVKRGAV